MIALGFFLLLLWTTLPPLALLYQSKCAIFDKELKKTKATTTKKDPRQCKNIHAFGPLPPSPFPTLWLVSAPLTNTGWLGMEACRHLNRRPNKTRKKKKKSIFIGIGIETGKMMMIQKARNRTAANKFIPNVRHRNNTIWHKYAKWERYVALYISLNGVWVGGDQLYKWEVAKNETHTSIEPINSQKKKMYKICCYSVSPHI